MKKKNTLIHHEKFLKLNNLVLLILSIVVLSIYVVMFTANAIFTITIFIVISLAIFVWLSRRNSVYFIYEDRIELFDSFSNKLKNVIKIDQIEQVRYEDSFKESYGFIGTDFIIIYPKSEVAYKGLRENRISLSITSSKRESKILELLNFFQSKNLEVVIKTDSEKIHHETGLENWDKT